jgi:hypothetical protein
MADTKKVTPQMSASALKKLAKEMGFELSKVQKTVDKVQPKKPRGMRGGGAAKKMMRGGAAKKMMRGGAATAKKKPSMMRGGGMAKAKKMMRGGKVKK